MYRHLSYSDCPYKAMGKTYGNYSVRRLAEYIFYLNLWDIVTDLTYYCSRDFWVPGLRTVCMISLLANSVGTLLLLLTGFCVNLFVKHQFGTSDTSAYEDLSEMMGFWHSLYFKRALEVPTPSNKALHRASLLVHIALQAIPQMVIQGLNNQRLGLWLQPLSLMSFGSSACMVLVAAVTLYQTDKYGHYY